MIEKCDTTHTHIHTCGYACSFLQICAKKLHVPVGSHLKVETENEELPHHV